MNLLTDLEEFVHDHRPHGTLTSDATELDRFDGAELVPKRMEFSGS